MVSFLLLLLPLLHLVSFPLLLRPALALALPQPQPKPKPKPSDTDALTIFRARADTHGNLAANWSSPDACTGRWRGVGCRGGRVTSLSLPSLDLRGPLDPLSHLDQLRLLDLQGNRLNGTLLPLLPALPNLKLLYLSRNDLSGPIPPAVGLLLRLLRLDLSGNSLSGPIPGHALANLTRLLTLRLQDNLLSGPLPDLSSSLPRLAHFNASNNELSGSVPDRMRAKFGVASFAGNAGLCGPITPLPLCSLRPPSSQTEVVPSKPSSIPNPPAAMVGGEGGAGKGGARRDKDRLSAGAIIGIAVGNAVFLLAVATSMLLFCSVGHWHSDGGEQEAGKEGDRRSKGGGSYLVEEGEQEKDRPSGESDEGSAAPAQHKLVFFEQGHEEHSSSGSSDGRGSRRQRRRRQFELEELLRASAEMVGKGGLGTVYRAVLEDGCMVAVKRLRDANPCPRRAFARYMDIIGRLGHPNLVPLRAYYYAKQEKLLIYDYLPNGSLYALLHGNRGAGRVPLDWTTRVSLLLGAARGLACIHQEYSSSRIPHGNIKTSNVLLDKNGVALISDFGLALLLNPAHATARLGGYKAPEQADSRMLSQEADVYAFGVLLLEVLTGRVPSQQCPAPSPHAAGVNLPEWVRSVVREEWTAEVFDAELMRYKKVEEEMVAMLHVGLACVAHQPDRRPTMPDVAKMIQDIRVEQSPLPEEDMNESRSRTSLSPSLPTTEEDARLSY